MKTNQTTDFLQLMKQLKWPKRVTIAALLLSLVEAVAGLMVPLVTKNLVDTLAEALLNWRIAIVLLGVFVLQAFSGGLSHYLLTYMGETIVADLRKQLWAKVLRLPVPYYDAHESGETMSRLTQDTMTVKELVTHHLVTFVSGLISIVGSFLILFVLNWQLTLILLISVPLSLGILLPLGRIMHRVAKATQAEMASFSGHLGRVLGDIRLVKASRAEKMEENKGSVAIQSLFQFGLKEAKIQAIVSPMMTLTMMSMLVVILGYGGAQVSKGDLSAGTLVAIILLMFQIIMPFAQMAQFFTSFQKAVGATERIQQLLQMTEEPRKGMQAIPSGVLRFEEVSFGYEVEQPILRQLTFDVHPGTVTAFVGPSGGGKTTIFSLLERFYLPTSGKITIGGQSIQQWALDDWRKGIGYVSQESPLLSGTIRDNIMYGLTEHPTEEAFFQAVEAANALEFINELPHRFETLVGERGIKLSGGQRQRIAIARALLSNPSLLLLDEATSNLDSGSESHVQEALKRLMEGRTTLIIAHRLATVIHAEQIIFLESGRITGMGTHDQLVASHEQYRKFAEGQGLS